MKNREDLFINLCLFIYYGMCIVYIGRGRRLCYEWKRCGKIFFQFMDNIFMHECYKGFSAVCYTGGLCVLNRRSGWKL